MAWAWPQFILWLCLLRCAAERPATRLGVLSSSDEAAASALQGRGRGRGHEKQLHGALAGALGSLSWGGQPDCSNDEHEAFRVLSALGVQEHFLQGDYCGWPGWPGITCHGRCVKSIELGQDTHGELPELWHFGNLLEVRISSAKVRGDIKALEKCADLKFLFLNGAASIGGDIRVLSNMKLLKEVDLRKTQVSGDIKALEKCADLEFLKLDGAAAIGGDIRVFESLAGLKTLGLKRTQVHGDIQAFQASAKLQALGLSGTQVYGDIRAFEATRKLMQLSLTATRISGNIQAFEKTRLLVLLALSLTEVEGDIKAFTTTRHLRWLSLQSTKVCGNIVALRGAVLLSDLNLRSTNVQGDIEALVSTSSLEQLALGGSKVSGNVGIFNLTTFSKLWKLYLDHTNVVGNVAFIGSLPRLLRVDLAATRISGDIDAFSRNTKLGVVRCQNTDVKGDIQSFEHLPHLKELDMSFTNVTGDVAVFAGKKSLHTLKLASTRMSGDIGDLVSRDSGFQVVELSSTSVAGNIWVFQHASYLTELHLADTQVAGSMEGILHWEKVQVVDLSKTKVEGRLTRRWRGCCKELRTLRLSDPNSGSEVRFIPAGDDRVDLLQLPQSTHPEKPSLQLLPALTTLEVSGCQLQGPVSDLLLPLAFCEHLGSVLARDSGLTGDLPTTDPLPAFSVGPEGIVSGMRSPLSTSLEVLDLSGNNLSRIAAVPRAMYSIGLSSNKQPLQLAEGVLTKVCKARMLVDLKDTLLDKATLDEIRKLIEKGTVNLTERQVFLRESEGYSCVDLDRSGTTLEVTPSKILPHEWCACLSGWYGAGTNCTECPENFFNNETNSSSCSRCPEHTNSSKGSKHVHDCKCKVGSLHQVRGEWLCGCPDDQALLNDNCGPCHDRHLNCSGYSSNATTAQPLPGYARLELKADKAFQCLDTKRCPGDGGAASGPGCGSGYDGPLCTGCQETFFAAGNSCLPCSNKDQHLPAWVLHAMASVMIVALLWAGVVAVAYFVYSWRPGQWLEAQLQTLRPAVFAEGVVGSLQEKLLKSQAPVLLQMCQLWVVLAVLASNKEKEGDEESSSRLWELPYMQTLQFAIGNLQELLYLQCYLGGPPVRLALAILTPVLPLALLLCSSGLEVFRRGAGVSAALKVLPIFFIGGASKCFALRSCQLFDAGGEKLENFAFLRQLPDLRCDQDVAWADFSPEQKLVSSVFWPCAICYGILIPCFLFYLYFRQHVLLRYSRVPLQLTQGGKEQHLAVGVQDRMLERRVVAAAVAYIAMGQQGTVRIQLSNGKGLVTFMDKPDSLALELEVDATSNHFKKESDKLRHHHITEMLLEQTILEEVCKSDRFLAGAHETLLKYASCRDLWMEVVLRLVAVALVKVVSAAQVASSTATEDLYLALAKVVALTLCIAGTVWMVRPYAQPQVNYLQSCCFLSLSISSLGFGLQMPWLSRAALLVPLLLGAGQWLEPDSAESLARRLWEELSTAPKELEEDADHELASDAMVAKDVETLVLTRRQPAAVKVSLQRPDHLDPPK